MCVATGGGRGHTGCGSSSYWSPLLIREKSIKDLIEKTRITRGTDTLVISELGGRGWKMQVQGQPALFT